MKQDFCIQMEALLGQDEANMLTQAIEQSTPPVSVRVNALKPSDTLPAPPTVQCPGVLRDNTLSNVRASPTTPAACRLLLCARGRIYVC